MEDKKRRFQVMIRQASSDTRVTPMAGLNSKCGARGSNAERRFWPVDALCSALPGLASELSVAGVLRSLIHRPE